MEKLEHMHQHLSAIRRRPNTISVLHFIRITACRCLRHLVLKLLHIQICCSSKWHSNVFIEGKENICFEFDFPFVRRKRLRAHDISILTWIYFSNIECVTVISMCRGNVLDLLLEQYAICNYRGFPPDCGTWLLLVSWKAINSLQLSSWQCWTSCCGKSTGRQLDVISM